MNSKLSPARVRALERRGEAMRRRRQGETFDQIAAALQISRPAAYQIVKREVGRLNGTLAEDVTAVRRIELERLDAVTQRLFSILNGDDATAKDRIAAATALVRVGERRSKLLGLDAPTRVETTTDRFADMSDAELIEYARRLGVPVPPGLQHGAASTQPPAVAA